MKYLEEKDSANLYEKVDNFGEIVLMISLVVKVEEVDGVAQVDYMDGIVHEIDLVLITLGIDQHDKTEQPQEPIYKVNCLYMLRVVIVFEQPM